MPNGQSTHEVGFHVIIEKVSGEDSIHLPNFLVVR